MRESEGAWCYRALSAESAEQIRFIAVVKTHRESEKHDLDK